MVDYDFYVNQYMGNTIPENAFSGMVSKAQSYLARLKRIYRVESTGQESENMALCAMAEVLWAGRNCGISSASVGGVSVHYENDRGTVQRALYEKASIYLDIYRGVGV